MASLDNLPEGVEPILSKLQLAAHQLDRALLLYLEEEDFICAVTLAGAAGEILKNLLGKENKKPTLKQFIDLSMMLSDDPKTGGKKLEKLIADMANFHRNELKHYRDGDAVQVARGDADEMLQRVISDFNSLTGKTMESISRYVAAVQAR